MIETVRHELLGKIALLFFIGLTIWWVLIYLGGTKTAPVNYLFGGIYGSMALLGGVGGFISAQKWGGMKSVMGKAILVFSLGLLFQTFGQYVFWYYNYFLKVEVPYPSIA